MKRVMMKDCACFFCGDREDVQGIARDDGAALIAICAGCRRRLAVLLTEEATPEPKEQEYSEAARRVMAAAAGMTEEAFGEKYLKDPVERIIFEYVRGYGTTELGGEALGLLSIMAEESVDVVSERLTKTIEDGLIYPVTGRPGWFGAEYPFADD